MCTGRFFFYSSSRAGFSTGDFPFFLSGPCLLRGSVWHLPSPIPFYTKKGVWKGGTFPPFREGENLQLPGKLLGLQTRCPSFHSYFSSHSGGGGGGRAGIDCGDSGRAQGPLCKGQRLASTFRDPLKPREAACAGARAHACFASNSKLKLSSNVFVNFT